MGGSRVELFGLELELGRLFLQQLVRRHECVGLKFQSFRISVCCNEGPAELDLALRGSRKLCEDFDFACRPRMRLHVDRAKCADHLPVDDEWNADIRSDTKGFYCGHVAVSRIGRGVRDDEGLGALNRVVTERQSRQLTFGRERLAKSARRLVEVAIFIDERNEGCRDANQPDGEASQAVKDLLGLCVQQIGASNRRQAFGGMNVQFHSYGVWVPCGWEGASPLSAKWHPAPG